MTERTTIDLPPPWAYQVRICIALLQDGNPAGVQEAKVELTRMGQLMDSMAGELLRLQEELERATGQQRLDLDVGAEG